MASPRSPNTNTPNASWFTPTRLLVLFCVMAFLVYLDRGVVASAAVSGSPGSRADGGEGSGLQGDFHVGYAWYGALQAAFMLGLLTGAPVFSALAKSWNPFKLIGCGLLAWCFATAGCAVATNYTSFFVFRVFVGLGEASFCALAAPFIDDYAPVGKKTLWLAVFYLCIPLGVAGGVMFGGAVGGSDLLGWRWAFGLESVCMVPVAAFCLVSPAVRMKGIGDEHGKRPSTNQEEGDALLDLETDAQTDVGNNAQRIRGNDRAQASKTTSATDFKSLVGNKTFLVALGGYVSYTACVGVYASWGPKAGYGIYADSLGSPQKSDLVFGAATAVAGVFGTLLGGVAVDFFPGSASGSGPGGKNSASVVPSLAVCAVSGFTAFAFLECAFNLNLSFESFLLTFFAGQVFLFCVQAPVNAAVLRAVKQHERPLACSLVTVCIHLLGDVPTPPLFGFVLERVTASNQSETKDNPNDWRVTLAWFTTALCFASFVWGIGAGYIWRLNGHSGDGEGGERPEDEQSDSRCLEEEVSVPFLADDDDDAAGSDRL